MSTGSSSSTEFEAPICISSDRKREAKAHGLFQSLYSWIYWYGPHSDRKDNSALEFLKLLC